MSDKYPEGSEHNRTHLNVFNSQVLSNASVGPPQIGTGTTGEFGSLLRVAAESRTFTNWEQLPWKLFSTTSVLLATLDGLNVNFVRATDPDTGILVVFATILYRKSSNGWTLSQNTNTPLRVLIENDAGGLLEDWEVTSTFEVDCGDAGQFVGFKQTFRPDWFDLATKVIVVIGATTWFKC
jgi:hypothetical protein